MISKVIALRASGGFQLNLRCWASEFHQKKVAGVILIAHGMSEHSLRYCEFAEFLTSRNFAVFAHDHRGHGSSLNNEKELGVFADENGWDKVVTDLELVRSEAEKMYPESPVILLGHSMGSFIAQSYAAKFGQKLSGLILSGSTYMSPLEIKLASLVAKIEAWRLGLKKTSKVIQFLSFGSFNSTFKPNRTEYDWLSRDYKSVDQYINDPLCGFQCTNSLWVDFLGGLEEVFSAKKQQNIPKNLPVYLVSGAKDPVCKGGGLTKLYNYLDRLGLNNLSFELLDDCRHEVLNELNKDEVFEKINSWLDEKVLKN